MPKSTNIKIDGQVVSVFNQDTFNRLKKLKVDLTKKRGFNVSYGEVISILLDNYKQQKKEN